ncbi:hypothetical protein [Prevotella sp.]|uniref:hypothetical protein n=1 Tax=Prevotella sp. TaxID=59823 RepID=UPI00308045E9
MDVDSLETIDLSDNQNNRKKHTDFEIEDISIDDISIDDISIADVDDCLSPKTIEEPFECVYGSPRWDVEREYGYKWGYYSRRDGHCENQTTQTDKMDIEKHDESAKDNSQK